MTALETEACCGAGDPGRSKTAKQVSAVTPWDHRDTAVRLGALRLPDGRVQSCRVIGSAQPLSRSRDQTAFPLEVP
jgi:hypothetical protein